MMITNDGIGDHALASLQMFFQLSSNSSHCLSAAADLWNKGCLKKSRLSWKPSTSCTFTFVGH